LHDGVDELGIVELEGDAEGVGVGFAESEDLEAHVEVGLVLIHIR
jgi:hypothetical protein